MSVLNAGAGCDMLLVQPCLSRHGHCMYAKNTDLPPEDKQYLEGCPAADHDDGAQMQVAVLKCFRVMFYRNFNSYYCIHYVANTIYICPTAHFLNLSNRLLPNCIDPVLPTREG